MQVMVDSNSECTYLATFVHPAIPAAVGEYACLSFSFFLVATVFMH